MTAGQLQHRVRFESRVNEDDGFGNKVGAFAPRFTRWAEVKPLSGGETVLAARLQGTQPVLIRVRLDGETAAIVPSWRAVDVRTGTTYALRAAADTEQRRAFLTIVGEAGVADG